LTRAGTSKSEPPAPPDRWLRSLERFFEERADSVSAAPDQDLLGYVSGRDPRLWRDRALLEDLRSSILRICAVDRSSAVLEVGCAAGFIARLVAPHVGRYTGVDLAKGALDVARRLALPNADFVHVRPGRLPFGDGAFGATICYDVVTNYPDHLQVVPLIAEMLRVTRPDGVVLVGNIPDRAQREALYRRAGEVTAALDAKFGPIAAPVPPPPRRSLRAAIARIFERVVPPPPPRIVTYEFDRENFLDIGRRLGARTEIAEIHPLSPYAGLRFNAIFRP
jgi:SAM-dependent methyltransferase